METFQWIIMAGITILVILAIVNLFLTIKKTKEKKEGYHSTGRGAYGNPNKGPNGAYSN